MPRPFPPEFRARAIALVRAGKHAKQTAVELGIHPVTCRSGCAKTTSTTGSAQEFPRASALSCELLVAGSKSSRPNWDRAAGREVPRRGQAPPKRLYPVIERLVDAGAPVDTCCRILGVTRQSYYRHKRTPSTPRQQRREWLTGLIREVHVASRGTYGYRRVHAELTMAVGIQVCQRSVSVLMTQAGIYGLPGLTRVKRLRGVVIADDLVNRKFHRIRPNELWFTDITQHRTREGWLYCARGARRLQPPGRRLVHRLPSGLNAGG